MVARKRTMCDIKWHPKALITSIVFGVSSITGMHFWSNLHVIFRLNSLIPMSDQVWISPYNINTISSNENKEKYQLGDDLSIQYQILQTNKTPPRKMSHIFITNNLEEWHLLKMFASLQLPPPCGCLVTLVSKTSASWRAVWTVKKVHAN